MSREIELFSIKAQVPEHPRFYRCPITNAWMFATGGQSGYPIHRLTELPADWYDLESACCIAIVWWNERAGFAWTMPEVVYPEDARKFRADCAKQVDAWRSILRKSQEAADE